MGLLDNFLGGKTNPKVTTTTNATFPQWYQDWLNATLGKANSVANEPYQPYKGPRIAPFSNDTKNAFSTVRSGIGQYAPTMNQGIDYTKSAGAGFNQDEFNSFMNPYVNNVVDRIGTLAGRNLSENLLPAVNDSFIRSGQFGSSRNTDFTLRALRDTQESALAQQNQALAQGFDTSMGNYQDMLQRRLQAGQGLGSLAQLGQGLNLQDAAALQSIGGAQEDKTQQSLNLAYQDFQQQRDYPRYNLDWFSSLLRGTQPPASTSTTGPGTASQMAPNSLSQLAGTALGIYGLSGGFKRGGRVRRRPTPAPHSRGLGRFAAAA